MIDLHAHILPNMDDGSRSVAESIRMLEASADQGVKYIAATPHFYAAENSPAQFLRRREMSAAMLRPVWQSRFPQLALGAEVYYFDGISRTQELDLLKLEHTDLLLLEMPFSAWTGRMVAELLELQGCRNTTVVLAHIERYLAFQKPEVWRKLLDGGVRMQCNAEFFLHWRTRRKALRMLRQGKVHFLGSDCHNMEARPPRLGEAMEAIDKAMGAAGRHILDREAAVLLAGSGGALM